MKTAKPAKTNKSNKTKKNTGKKKSSVLDLFNAFLTNKKRHDAFVKRYMATGLTPEEFLLKTIFHDTGIKTQKHSKEEAERAFIDDVDGEVLALVKFDKNLLIECLQEYNDWRRGVGKYEFNEDPVKNKKCPFSPLFIGMMIQSAAEMLSYADDKQYEKDYIAARQAALKAKAMSAVGRIGASK